MASADSNKAKIAKRVIEVLEFFDEQHPQATVMDIVRRFNRPQSSTSELLSSLVDLGLLYKDPGSRSYSPTPRAAMLGSAVQPSIVRDGKLTTMIDRLVAQTGLAVAVFGMVGLKAQIFSWHGGTQTLRTADRTGFCGGKQECLTATAVGWLLLSTIMQPRRDGVIRRLNAEAAEDAKFPFAEMALTVQQAGMDGFASGVAGYGSIADITAMLIPGQPDNQPLAIGFVYNPSDAIEPGALRQCLADAFARTNDDQPVAPGFSSVQPLFNVA